MSEFPCPVPPKPSRARGWCKHYSYVLPKFPRSTKTLDAEEGPQCAIGCDLSAPGASTACLPDGSAKCAKREDWSADEKVIWSAWKDHHMKRVFVCMAAIPEEGWSGKVPCPACGDGTISWSRARVNNHVHARCSTDSCFGIMQ